MSIKASEVKSGDTVVCDKTGLEMCDYEVGNEYLIEKVEGPQVFIVNSAGKSWNWSNLALRYFSKVEKIPFNNYTE